MSKQQWARLGVWAIGKAMYAAVLAAFILMQSITNWPLLRISRTAAITLSTFIITLTLFSRIYGGFRIGQLKCRNIIYSVSIATVLTDVISYFEMQVMNVNENNHATLQLFGQDMILLIGAVAIQLVIIMAAVLGANWLYFRFHPPMKCVIIAGSETEGRMMRRKLERFAARYQVCNVILPDNPDFKAVIRANEAAFLYHLPPDKRREMVEYCYKHGRKLYFDLNIEDILARNCETFLVDDVQMTVHTKSGLSMPQRFAKRTMDIVVSLVGVLLTSPIMLGCAIAIRREDGGPVFFKQKRMSRNGEIFDIIKFRTMKVHADQIPQHSAQVDDPRITRVGKFLRRTRIDELPQLFNILHGEMSLVGPRPEMLENIENYMKEMPEFAYRNRVKAGLTGTAQVNGKYNTPPREKLMMDISYIEDYSFWLDIKLMLKTLLVFFREDATEAFEKEETDAK